MAPLRHHQGVGGEEEGQVQGVLRAQEAAHSAPSQGHETGRGAAQLSARNSGTHQLHFLDFCIMNLVSCPCLFVAITSHGCGFDGNMIDRSQSFVQNFYRCTDTQLLCLGSFQIYDSVNFDFTSMEVCPSPIVSSFLFVQHRDLS